MSKYVALLRGIGPANPNMQQKKLCMVLESLGFSNVRGVISSGNVVFESDSKDTRALESMIEQAWPKQLGFNSTTIIRSQSDLEALVAKDPYRGVGHNQQNYQLVTFFKNPPKIEFKLPYTPEGKDYTLLQAYGREICSVIDMKHSKTPDLMSWLERQFGKELTSRTWKTVQRILNKMEATS